jgi:hypothetical protein
VYVFSCLVILFLYVVGWGGDKVVRSRFVEGGEGLHGFLVSE